MSDILLVHGAAHGAWCWRDVVPALKALGHSVTVIDLPGHGDNPAPISTVTLEAYRDAILTALKNASVVVGHSMAGYPITAAAEQAPDKISRLIYLCAHVPAPGQSLSDMRKLVAEQPLIPAMKIATDKQSFVFRPELAEQCFYHDCPDGTLDYALPRLVPQAVSPNMVTVDTGANYASVPRSYIRCTQDGAIPPKLQSLVSQGFPRKDVHDMATGHSPFFADPSGLADLIDRIIKD